MCVCVSAERTLCKSVSLLFCCSWVGAVGGGLEGLNCLELVLPVERQLPLQAAAPRELMCLGFCVNAATGVQPPLCVFVQIFFSGSCS